MKNKYGTDHLEAIEFWQIQEVLLCDLSEFAELELTEAAKSAGLDSPLQKVWDQLSPTVQEEIGIAWSKDYEN